MECVSVPASARTESVARYGEASPELVANDRADERRRATPKTPSVDRLLSPLDVGRSLVRHYVGRDKRGPWLLRSTQISLNEEA